MFEEVSDARKQPQRPAPQHAVAVEDEGVMSAEEGARFRRMAHETEGECGAREEGGL